MTFGIQSPNIEQPRCIKEGRDTIDSPSAKINYYCNHIQASSEISLQTIIIAKSKYSEDEQPLWYNFFPEQPPKCHNCKSQRMNNQYYALLDNLQDITFEMFSEFL